MKAPPFTDWRGFGSLLALLLAGCSNTGAPSGELMLAITTDLAVPNDLERVAWSITLDGEGKTYASGVIQLTSGSELPATLAVRAGSQTTAPITVRVEGWKGEATSPRVSREAKVLVPRDRVAKLELPLSWLCSDAVLSEPCAHGFTCRGGQCVEAAVDATSLPAFEAAAETACVDVGDCVSKAADLRQPGPMTLESGREVPCALSGLTTLGPKANVSVAVEVRSDLVGNYGFCGPFDACFIPLDRSDRGEGWRVLENGATPAIELPPAVCKGAGVSTSRVAITWASESCPSQRRDRPLCPPPEKGCLADSRICPSFITASPVTESPKRSRPTKSDWVGFTCNDVNPTELHEGLLKCWNPSQPKTEGEPPTDGRWCCLEAPKEDTSVDPLLIDDMTGGSQIKLSAPSGTTAGWWHTEIPNGSGDISPAPKDYLYTYRQFDEPVGPRGGPAITAAACLSSTGFKGWLALQGFFLFGSRDAWRTIAVDVSDYAGISFWGWAHEPFADAPLGVSVSFPNVQTSLEVDSECSVAEPGGRLCDNFFKEVTLGSEWKQYVVRWDELAQTQYDWGQLRFEDFERRINGIYFSVAGAGPAFMSQPFDFCVTDVRFIPKDEASP